MSEDDFAELKSVITLAYDRHALSDASVRGAVAALTRIEARLAESQLATKRQKNKRMVAARSAKNNAEGRRIVEARLAASSEGHEAAVKAFRKWLDRAMELRGNLRELSGAADNFISYDSVGDYLPEPEKQAYWRLERTIREARAALADTEFVVTPGAERGSGLHSMDPPDTAHYHGTEEASE
jgi:hypothetical protein